jgi:hypothetical protein
MEHLVMMAYDDALIKSACGHLTLGQLHRALRSPQVRNFTQNYFVLLESRRVSLRLQDLTPYLISSGFHLKLETRGSCRASIQKKRRARKIPEREASCSHARHSARKVSLCFENYAVARMDSMEIHDRWLHCRRSRESRYRATWVQIVDKKGRPHNRSDSSLGNLRKLLQRKLNG